MNGEKRTENETQNQKGSIIEETECPLFNTIQEKYQHADVVVKKNRFFSPSTTLMEMAENITSILEVVWQIGSKGITIPKVIKFYATTVIVAKV